MKKFLSGDIVYFNSDYKDYELYKYDQLNIFESYKDSYGGNSKNFNEDSNLYKLFNLDKNIFINWTAEYYLCTKDELLIKERELKLNQILNE
jgi:hypothetical protein